MVRAHEGEWALPVSLNTMLLSRNPAYALPPIFRQGMPNILLSEVDEDAASP